ncbi:MAG: putative toxin-antitoxin system toxin component, PIN family [Saprospiraceae bacterium]|nr:putative toxin-antitoxin system toxin component, PIN family [Saprospiraceae bacterium]
MQSIILDTNVVVSALISKTSPPSRIIDELVLNRRIELFISEETFAEYIEVLGPEKFARFLDFKARAEILLNRLHEISRKYAPEIRLDIILDEEDNRFLELALIAQPDFLITGNTNDFTMQTIGRTQIVTPREFCDFYWPEG